MDKGLVTIGGTRKSVQLLLEAAEHAAGSDAELILLSILTEAEYDHNLEVLDRIAQSERSFGSDEGAVELAEDLGRSIAKEILAQVDIDYQIVGGYVQNRIGRRIIREADERGCDHVFVLGKERARFGTIFSNDPARKVLQEFDGFVTTGRETEPDKSHLEYRDGRLTVPFDLSDSHIT